MSREKNNFTFSPLTNLETGTDTVLLNPYRMADEEQAIGSDELSDETIDSLEAFTTGQWTCMLATDR